MVLPAWVAPAVTMFSSAQLGDHRRLEEAIRGVWRDAVAPWILDVRKVRSAGSGRWGVLMGAEVGWRGAYVQVDSDVSVVSVRSVGNDQRCLSGRRMH
jgi:hypothetical protein